MKQEIKITQSLINSFKTLPFKEDRNPLTEAIRPLLKSDVEVRTTTYDCIELSTVRGAKITRSQEFSKTSTWLVRFKQNPNHAEEITFQLDIPDIFLAKADLRENWAVTHINTVSFTNENLLLDSDMSKSIMRSVERDLTTIVNGSTRVHCSKETVTFRCCNKESLVWDVFDLPHDPELAKLIATLGRTDLSLAEFKACVGFHKYVMDVPTRLLKEEARIEALGSISPIACLKCESTKIYTIELSEAYPEAGHNVFKCDVGCTSCGYKWREVFAFSHLENEDGTPYTGPFPDTK